MSIRSTSGHVVRGRRLLAVAGAVAVSGGAATETAVAQISAPCGGKYIGKASRDIGTRSYQLTSKSPGTFPSSRVIEFRMRWTYYRCRRSWRLTLQPRVSDGAANTALRVHLRDQYRRRHRTAMHWRWGEGWLQTQSITGRTRRWFPESALMAGFTMWTGDDAETRAAGWWSPRDATGWDIKQPRR
jgi:hypothetical protein